MFFSGPGGGGKEPKADGAGLKALLCGAPGGGGREKELELLIVGRAFIERLDMELPMEESDGFEAELLLPHGFDVLAEPQLTVEVGAWYV